MDEFPTSEDEFELMYGDDLDVLREHGDIEKSPKKSRKSLEFTPTSEPIVTNSQESFENDFVPLDASVVPSGSQQPLNANKRSIEQLFGDIDDILYEGQGSKRHKGDEHLEDLALIEHIIELRKLAKERDLPEIRKKAISVSDRDKNNLSYHVPNYPFVALTRYDGERVYVRCHSEQYEKEETQRIVEEINLSGNLGCNKDLWDQAQDLIVKQTENQQLEIPTNPTPNDKDLWVDLYKPRKYFELLSDESTNRIMLKWMKLWDKVVFQRKPKIKPTKPINDKFKSKFVDLCTDLDEHGRPFHKVALLCGPPGLGKTTLAHMVARHAGYNPVEINASDDRSIENFKKSLENATQMRSVLDSEKRPNCLIFDEIDGAPSASIEYLVKFITGTISNKNKKKLQKDKNILKRPIICICNDVYVPALRSLRQIAFVVNFPSTSNTRLAERLMEIAKWQNVKTDMGAMLALAEKSNNDIRSCLSVLHFFKTQDKPVTLLDIHKSSVGQKDTHKGIFSIWQDIFLIGKTNVGNDKKTETFKERLTKIINIVNSFGDYEKLSQGVFENYPLLKYKNSDMNSTCGALEWFSYTDILNREIYSTQNYNLASYLQYAFVVWHFTFASRTWQKLQYPNAGYETKLKQNKQKAMISEMIRGLQPKIRSYVQKISLKLDIIPILTKILTPSFRPISLHLYTDEEKKIFEHVVGVMIDYNLNYIQERTAEGTYIFKLDPAIDEIVSFISMKTLSYSNKQLIAQEIETEKMRRFESTHHIVEQKKTFLGYISDVDSSLPNHLQTLKAKTVCDVQKPTVVKDFFGRIISKNSSSGKLPAEMKTDIWFQYKEGYNNAVRKKIKIASLK